MGAAAEAAAGPQCSSHPGGPAAASPGTVSETPPTSQDSYARRGPPDLDGVEPLRELNEVHEAKIDVEGKSGEAASVSRG